MKKQTKHAIDIKKEKVQQLAEKIKKAKTIAFADYRGLTAEQLNEIRNKVRKTNGEFIVAKNSLLKLALVKSQLPATAGKLEGPTATIFAYEDEIAPLKQIADSQKSLGLPNFKFGFFQKSFLDANALDSLSKIPPREVLYAKVVGALNSPISGVVSVLGANIRNLVSVLDQATKQGTSTA